MSRGVRNQAGPVASSSLLISPGGQVTRAASAAQPNRPKITLPPAYRPVTGKLGKLTLVRMSLGGVAKAANKSGCQSPISQHCCGF